MTEITLSDEQMNKIINKAIEGILLQMPDVIGNLMKNHAVLHKTNREFYERYPEFAKHKNVVASVLQQIEGTNPTAKYEDILQQAMPEIQRQIDIVKNSSMKRKPLGEIDFSYDGSVHGEI